MKRIRRRRLRLARKARVREGVSIDEVLKIIEKPIEKIIKPIIEPIPEPIIKETPIIEMPIINKHKKWYNKLWNAIKNQKDS